jgi:hypothetical protein
MDYQKDGPGPLLRCYTDRIHHPARLREESFSVRNVGRAPPLSCSGCGTTLGTPFIYRRKKDEAKHKVTENRPAYLVVTDPVVSENEVECETAIPRIECREKNR